MLDAVPQPTNLLSPRDRMLQASRSDTSPEPGLLLAPQFAQEFCKEPPRSPQNLLVGGSLLQFTQTIRYPTF
jgi:hypothetical protein